MSEHTHISRRPCLHLTVTNLPVALAIVDPIGIFAFDVFPICINANLLKRNDVYRLILTDRFYIRFACSTRDFPKTPRTQAVRDYWLAGWWTLKNVAGWPVLGPGLLIKLIVANT